MNNLKIALLQIAPCGSLEKNRQKGIRACKEAAAKIGRASCRERVCQYV